MADNPEFRASDADRERTVDVLRDGFVQGRLTADEFHERMEAAYAAKTLAQLVPLTSDLPPTGRVGPASDAAGSPGAIAPAAHWQPVGRPHGDIRHSYLRELQRIWGGWLSMTIVLTVIWALSGASAGFSGFWPIWPIGVYGALCLARTVNGGGPDRQ